MDLVVLAGAAALLLESAETFQQLVVTLFVAGILQPTAPWLQTGLETPAGLREHRLFLELATRRMATQTEFLAIRAPLLLEMQPLLSSRPDAHRACRIKLVPATATHPRMVVVVSEQPRDVGIGRHAGIHDQEINSSLPCSARPVGGISARFAAKR